MNGVCAYLWLDFDIGICFEWCYDLIKQRRSVALHCYDVTPLLFSECDCLFISTTVKLIVCAYSQSKILLGIREGFLVNYKW